MSIEITDELVADTRNLIDERVSSESVYDMLTVVLNRPEIRDAIYADVRREVEAKLKAAGVTGYSIEGF